MPGLLQYKSDIHEESDPPEYPEDFDLWLPSKLPKEARQHVCIQVLPSIEEKLRTAQCFDALESVRHTLKIKSRLIKFKNKNIRGQREGTRSRAIIDRVHERARTAAAKYRAARGAKLMLSGPGEWESKLQVLADADIRAYQDPDKLPKKVGRRGTIEDEQISNNDEPDNFEEAMETEIFSLLPEQQDQRDGTGETRRLLLWIWLTGNTTADPDNDGDEILQIEWAKSRAHAARATEEVLLLKEEMRRVLEFLKWKAGWWVSRVELHSADKGIAEGLRAYSHKQSLLQNNLSQHFRSIWGVPLKNSATDGTPSQDQSPSGVGNDDNDDDDDDDDDQEECADGGPMECDDERVD